MGDNQLNASRRDALKTMFRGAGVLGLGGMAWGGVVDGLKASELALRPPGALAEKSFIKACVRCGSCVEACPYDALILATVDDHTAIGTPFFVPRETPCYMCTDVPCVPICPSGALDSELLKPSDPTEVSKEMDINTARMGVAVIDEEACLAFWGIQCDACYRACPLMGKAITLDFRRNDRTGKHALLEPHINRTACTGCGLCEHACVTEKPAVFVLPKELASGKVGNHYIKGWDKRDEKRLHELKEEQKKGSQSAEDYLNDLEDLIDE